MLEIFSFRLHWFPAIGNEGLASIILPAITLAIPTGAMVAQLLAKSLHRTMSEPYADTARAKGASERRVLLRHSLRNSVIPALTIAGVLVGQLLAGTVVTETVFSRTGLGRLTATAVSSQDIPVVQGLVIFGALVFVVVNLARRSDLPVAGQADCARPPAEREHCRGHHMTELKPTAGATGARRGAAGGPGFGRRPARTTRALVAWSAPPSWTG